MSGGGCLDILKALKVPRALTTTTTTTNEVLVASSLAVGFGLGRPFVALGSSIVSGTIVVYQGGVVYWAVGGLGGVVGGNVLRCDEGRGCRHASCG